MGPRGRGRGGQNGVPFGPPPGTPEVRKCQETITPTNKLPQFIPWLDSQPGAPAGPGRGPARRQVAPPAFRDFLGDFRDFHDFTRFSSDFPKFTRFHGFRAKTEPPSRRGEIPSLNQRSGEVSGCCFHPRVLECCQLGGKYRFHTHFHGNR